MLETLWDNAQQFFQTNQFAAGGLVMGAIAAILVYLKQLPFQLWDMLLLKFTATYSVWNETGAYKWIEAWLTNHEYKDKRCKRFYITAKTRNPISTNELFYIPDVGRPHILWYKKTLLILRRTEENLRQDDESHAASKRMGYSFRVFPAWRKNVIHDLIEEGFDLCQHIKEDGVMLYYQSPGNSYWYDNDADPYQPRSKESIISKTNIVQDIIDDIQQFEENEDWYLDKGIPYHRGYMLYGPPGNGKSSIIFTVASELKKNLALTSLSHIAESSLRQLFATLPKDTILVIEDIDTYNITRERSNEITINSKAVAFPINSQKEEFQSMSLSSLLNSLDGIGTKHGLIVFMTTNHIDKLDAALVRPGRIDRKYELLNPNKDEAALMFKKFFPNATDSQTDKFTNKVDGQYNMAQLQGHCLKYFNDIEKTIGEPIV